MMEEVMPDLYCCSNKAMLTMVQKNRLPIDSTRGNFRHPIQARLSSMLLGLSENRRMNRWPP